MLLFMDGFDLCSYAAAPIKYNDFFQNFNQGRTITGADGASQAIVIDSTAFGETDFRVAFGTRNTFGVHLHVLFSGFQTGIEWFRISNGGGTLLAIRSRPDGKLDLVKYPGATVIATSTAALTAGAWTSVELKATASTVELRFNGATVASTGNSWSGGPPDRLAFRWQGFGPGIAVDDYVVWDDNPSDGIFDFLGPCRITSYAPIADLGAPWTPSTPGPLFQMVRDANGIPGSSPDGDLSYITPGNTTDQFFSLSSTTCFGLNFAVALNVCARPTSGSQTLGLVYLGTGPERLLETKLVTPVGGINAPNAPPALDNYFTFQTIVPFDADSGAVWTDAAITAGAWGVEGNSLPLRVTALYLEKLTSLLPLPYSCGGASNYAF